ncbi:bidirectional sugar transporter SWEET4-like isoform X2 [Magnolia sinica]|nr:bidirectional sugar transporter SWEET4-like isoform X2 [Magnolia sinica]
MPTFCHIWKKRSVEQFSPIPYLAALLNCTLWMLYGLPMVQPHCILIVTINGSGFLIELFYVLMFIYYSDRKKRMQVLVMLLLEVCFCGAVAAFVLLVVHTPERRSLIVGSLCVFFTTLMYAAPLSVMKIVIRTRSVEFLPFYLSVASFANGTCWTAYALIRFDLFVSIANGVGVLMGLIQLGLHAAFYKSTKKQLGARKALGETCLAEIVLIGDTSKVCNAPQNGHATQIISK